VKNDIKELVELLKRIRLEKHGEKDNSLNQEIDRAIQKLEEDGKRKWTPKDFLAILGEIFKYLPSIAKVLEVLEK
jgi:DNA-binding transcriptional regulator GbsR (MarR family)